MENEKINNQILKIWEEYKRQKGTKRWPILYPECDILLALKGCPSGNFLLRKKRGVH